MIKRAICYLLALICICSAMFMFTYLMFNRIDRALFIAGLFALGALTIGFIILGDRLGEIEEEKYEQEK